MDLDGVEDFFRFLGFRFAFVLQHAPNALWPAAAALNIAAALSALALERHLPRAVARAPSRIEPVEVG